MEIENRIAEGIFNAESLTNRIDELDRQANRISEWLHAMSGLVEPGAGHARFGKTVSGGRVGLRHDDNGAGGEVDQLLGDAAEQ